MHKVLLLNLGVCYLLLNYQPHTQVYRERDNKKSPTTKSEDISLLKPFHTTMVVLFMTYSVYNKRYLLLHYQPHMYVLKKTLQPEMGTEVIRTYIKIHGCIVLLRQ